MYFELSCIMFASLSTRRASAFAFTARNQVRTVANRAFAGSSVNLAADGQAEVVLFGCGAPNRGMGWYHAVQLLDKK
jgi:hypothetical protein